MQDLRPSNTTDRPILRPMRKKRVFYIAPVIPWKKFDEVTSISLHTRSENIYLVIGKDISY